MVENGSGSDVLFVAGGVLLFTVVENILPAGYAVA
jgi:hypothetical protein